MIDLGEDAMLQARSGSHPDIVPLYFSPVILFQNPAGQDDDFLGPGPGVCAEYDECEYGESIS